MAGRTQQFRGDGYSLKNAHVYFERHRQYERYKLDPADVGAAAAPAQAQMPTLQFAQVQSGGAASVRWTSWADRAAPGAVYFLLAAVLLGVSEWSARGLR